MEYSLANFQYMQELMVSQKSLITIMVFYVILGSHVYLLQAIVERVNMNFGKSNKILWKFCNFVIILTKIFLFILLGSSIVTFYQLCVLFDLV